MASKERKAKAKGETILRPVLPNAGLEAEMRRKLTALIEEMGNSVQYWTAAAYRKNEPEVAALAQDETPADVLLKTIRGLRRRWLKRFDEAADRLADYFSTAIKDRSDAVLKKILKDGGFAIEWKMTPAMRDVMQATIGEQVGLIKSIPEKYFGQIEGAVMRSVQTGRDLKQLTDDLQKIEGVTRRRAVFIARDQNNKATASMKRARLLELGLDEETWNHSGGGRHPRPTHVKAGRDKTRYKVSEGWPDPALKGKKIWPGTEPNCKCFGRPVLKLTA
jgi:uncharacterized protein with gpF-like domain